MRDRWQLQEAKQRFSELIRSVEAEGPQVVTRHGEDVAVVTASLSTGICATRGKTSKHSCSPLPTLTWR